MTQNLIGQTFDRYQITAQIGEGGMAVVYKARDAHLDRDVAIKVIRTEKLTLDMMDKTLKRFEREAKALGRLNHPNIVQITDSGEYEGKPFLVMSYVPGGTLKSRLGQPLPWREAANLLVPVARALQYAHQQRVIHRDVKPTNILLTASGDPMLTDFGIAKVLLDTEETSDLTGTGMGIGTPEYMSPEQFQGSGVDARTDIYSLGVIYYEMVTGKKPYTAKTPAAILVKQATEPMPRPSMFIHDLPPAVENVLTKALAKKPEDRYPDMGAFLHDLEALGRGELPQTAASLTGTVTVHEYDPDATYQQKDSTYTTVQDKDYRRSQPVPPPSPTSVPPRNPINFLAWGVGALGLCVVGLIAVAFIVASTRSNPGTTYQPPVYQEPTATEYVYEPPTDAPYFEPTARPAPTDVPYVPPTAEPTSVPECPGTYPTRLRTGQNATICTKVDRLIVRNSPSMNASEVVSLYTGYTVGIVEGPVCADNFWWWKIEIYPGTPYGFQNQGFNAVGTTGQSYYGWAREGWDNKDKYFMCP